MALIGGSFFMLGWSVTVLAWLAGWIKIDAGVNPEARKAEVMIELRDQLQQVVEKHIEGGGDEV
jgi:hypothetical protein